MKVENKGGDNWDNTYESNEVGRYDTKTIKEMEEHEKQQIPWTQATIDLINEAINDPELGIYKILHKECMNRDEL
jgi:hypothetical protein